MSKNNYIILTAMEKECCNIKLPTVEKLITGIGGCNTVQTLFRNQDKLKDKIIINIGYAGSTQYELGSVVSVNKVLKYDKSNVIKFPEFSMSAYSFVENACYTADNFIEANGTYVPLVDMELYYIRMLYPNVYSFKIVSDNLDEKTYNKFNPEKSWKELNTLLKEFCYG